MMAEYKKNCIFRKIKGCGFRPEHCRPQQPDKEKEFCDFFDLEQTSRAMKTRINKVRREIKDLNNEKANK